MGEEPGMAGEGGRSQSREEAGVELARLLALGEGAAWGEKLGQTASLLEVEGGGEARD